MVHQVLSSGAMSTEKDEKKDKILNFSPTFTSINTTLKTGFQELLVKNKDNGYKLKREQMISSIKLSPHGTTNDAWPPLMQT